MLLYLAGLSFATAALLLTVPSMMRCLPDCRRSWQLRWSPASEVRADLVSALRTGREASTPALARDVVEYVAIMRRGLALLRTRAYLIVGALLTISGLLWMVAGVRLSSAATVVSALVLVTYPLTTWLYVISLSKKLDRAELGNAELAQRPDLHPVHSVAVDCISN